MDERDRLRFELGVLLASGRELSTYVQSENLDPRDVNERYQVWYTQTLRLVERVLPERRREFEGYYRSDQDEPGSGRDDLRDPRFPEWPAGDRREARGARRPLRPRARAGHVPPSARHAARHSRLCVAPTAPGASDARTGSCRQRDCCSRRGTAAPPVPWRASFWSAICSKVAQRHDLALSESDSSSLPRLESLPPQGRRLRRGALTADQAPRGAQRLLRSRREEGLCQTGLGAAVRRRGDTAARVLIRADLARANLRRDQWNFASRSTPASAVSPRSSRPRPTIAGTSRSSSRPPAISSWSSRGGSGRSRRSTPSRR